MKMLEIILVIVIIGIFATIVTPKLANAVDVAVLDREAKRFGSEIELLQSIGRTSEKNILLSIESKPMLNIKINVNKYEIVRDNEVLDSHKLPKGITISCNKDDLLNIKLNSSNKLYQSGHITLTSKLGHHKYIYIDSVGRWSISERERYD